MKLHPSLALWITLACAAALALSAPAAQAADGILYVASGGAAAGDCDSWAAACDLQYALVTKAQGGDELWVKAGTYTPASDGNRLATFQLRSGIALYGGFAGDETSRAQRDFTSNETILSGDLGRPGDKSDNAYHVVTGSGTDSTAVLDGFTITAGNADDFSAPHASGGGMVNIMGSPSVTNLIFRDNAAGLGGGMNNEVDSNPVLVNVIFHSNLSISGAGMSNLFHSNPTLSNVTFSSNSASFQGGGMFNLDSSPVLANVTFAGNAADNGGGIYVLSGSLSLVNVTFYENIANRAGGILSEGAWSLTIRNAIFWGNTSSQIEHASPSFTLSDSLVEGGCPPGAACTNILTGNPLLGPLGDYGGATHTFPLLPGSPAIDSGDAAHCPAADQRGISRPQGAGCDIGAFESRGFTLVKTGGDNQRTHVNTAFADPLALSVSSAYGEPVDGGVISMRVEPSSGAGANPENSTLVISNGAVSQSLAANGVPGSYTVSMNTPGAASPQTFTLTNDRWSTSITLASSANPSTSGEPVTFTATVSALPPGSGAPSGTVLFKAGGSEAGGSEAGGSEAGGTHLGEPVALVDGRASFTTTALEPGEHAITAEYSGAEDFDTSTSAVYLQTVSPKKYFTYIPYLSGQP